MAKDGNTTNPYLLGRVTDWKDMPAWSEFFSCYDPLIRRWCVGYGAGEGALDDLCQHIWIELAHRIQTYQYDPGRTFRGWLRTLCSSRTRDFFRRHRPDFFVALDESSIAASWIDYSGRADGDDETSVAQRPALLRVGEQVQRAVKKRVDPKTWRIFRQITIDGRSIRQIADDTGMTYAAVFAAHKRVVGMLRAESERRLQIQRMH